MFSSAPVFCFMSLSSVERVSIAPLRAASASSILVVRSAVLALSVASRAVFAASRAARNATSFLCVRFADNDVLALLEMMLTFGQMMLCPADTNEKILKAMLSGFFETC